MNTDQTNPDELVECPASAEHMWGAAEKFVIHRVTKAELEATGGVCRACREKFRKRNLSAQNGKVEKPVEFHHHRSLSVEEDGAGYGDDGEPVSIDAHELAEASNDLPPDAVAIAAEFLSSFLVWAWGKKRKPKAALTRLVVFTASVRPDLMDGKTFKELGKEIGLSRAALSKQSLELSDALAIKFTRSRDAKGRHNMKLARLEAIASHPSKESFTSNPT